MDLVSVENVNKSFRLKTGQSLVALDAVSFNVRPGSITALVGPDGAGKTTLLRIVAGLLAPTSGTLLFNGREPGKKSNDDVQARIGYMPQKFGLYEDLTVQENLDLYADLKGVGRVEREERYHALLAMSAMQPFRQRLAGKLSGGMKQKLGLICTLIAPPELLLLDEPTVGVDPLSRRELWDIVEGLTRSSTMSVIVSTSYLDEAEKCDDVVLLFEGKTLARGSPESIRKQTDGMGYLARPAAAESPRSLQARLLGAPGIIDAVPQGGAVRFVHGPLTDAEGHELSSLLHGATVQPVPASLEDSFMQLLRMHVKKPEPAAEKPVSTTLAPLSSASPAHQGDPIIQTRHVSRLFGDFIAVNDVSFSVYKGEVFGLLGPNGAGKTTTFRMLCGLLPASNGSLHVAGVDVREAREEARRHLGYVAQKFSLYGPLSVRENLEFFAGAYGLKGARKTRRIAEVVEEFHLEQQLHRPAESLPGGYKQRLAMAVGLLHEPEILFLDEPTSGADPLARRDFWKRISRLADQGVTIVVTTHFMEEAEYCDRILIQDSGIMLALGTPAQIRAHARSKSDADPARAEPTMEDAFIEIVARARAAKTEKAA
ncbi:ATP-binding cassette domain-containing protein [Desulfosarcina sp. OttesenSCG-928-A07]|nr:ATP-binding cassette domain-containing protein [Desulfosarcina sp. OttesenSCG-928-G17]MDL2330294.1 ATP-binding cassette domain-containing protein [Desulfosarcina sp. OttesenSCG-928-A07]